jgi:hypothetical protein
VLHAGFETNESVPKIVGIGGGNIGEIDVGVAPGETRCSHADDGVEFVIELNEFPENFAVATELLLPEQITEDGDGSGCAIGDVGGRKAAAKEKRNAHKVKEIRGIGADVNGYGEIGTGQIASVAGLKEEILNGRGRAKLLSFGAVNDEEGPAAVLVLELDVDHTVVVSVRIGIQKDGVDDAESCGGGANAECEGEDGGEDESGRLAELAESKAYVL